MRPDPQSVFLDPPGYEDYYNEVGALPPQKENSNMPNPTLTTPEGDEVELKRFDPDNPPEDMPPELIDLLNAIIGGKSEVHKHAHVSDVSFLLGDDGGRVHASLDICGLDVPENTEDVRVTAVFNFQRLPEEVREAWVTVVQYLENHINDDTTLFDRLTATVNSKLDCDLIIDQERQSL